MYTYIDQEKQLRKWLIKITQLRSWWNQLDSMFISSPEGKYAIKQYCLDTLYNQVEEVNTTQLNIKWHCLSSWCYYLVSRLTCPWHSSPVHHISGHPIMAVNTCLIIVILENIIEICYKDSSIGNHLALHFHMCHNMDILAMCIAMYWTYCNKDTWIHDPCPLIDNVEQFVIPHLYGLWIMGFLS